MATSAGCATVPDTGKRVFDPCKALSIAASSQQIADAGTELVCDLLPSKADREKCRKYKGVANEGVQAALGIAATVLKACGIGGK